MPVEGRREAVVAELGVHRGARIGDPVERAGVAGGDELRIVDLEACRHEVGERHPGEGRLRLGDLQHHDETLVLLGLCRVGIGAVKRMEAALQREALSSGRLWAGGRAADRDHRLHRHIPAIGHRDGASLEVALVKAAIERTGQRRLLAASIGVEADALLAERARREHQPRILLR